MAGRSAGISASHWRGDHVLTVAAIVGNARHLTRHAKNSPRRHGSQRPQYPPFQPTPPADLVARRQCRGPSSITPATSPWYTVEGQGSAPLS
jgi:hypothetical protein